MATTLASERQQPGLLAQCLSGGLDEADFVAAKRREDAELGWHAGPAAVAPLPPEAHLDGQALSALLRARPDTCVVDVREPYEQLLSQTPRLADWDLQALPLSRLVNGLGPWLEDDSRPLVFFCRTGNRSQQALQCLQRLGRANCYQLAGGLALWEGHSEFTHCI